MAALVRMRPHLLAGGGVERDDGVAGPCTYITLSTTIGLNVMLPFTG
jgi:hypothetical protein